MNTTKKAAIVIDDHKLEIFERHLGAAGYVFTKTAGPVEDTCILSVNTTNLEALRVVLQNASLEASGMGTPH